MADDTGTTSGEELSLEPVATGPVASRRRALWGVLAVVALCAGALAVVSGGDDGDAPRLPVALGAGGFESTAGAAADMSMAAWVTYVAGEGLPTVGGEGTAYRLVTTVDEARVASLAAALGATGEPVHDGGLWRVESDGAMLEVDEGTGTWWYSSTVGVAVGSGSGSSAGGAGADAFACDDTEAVCRELAERQRASEEVTATTEAPCPPDAGCVEPVPTDEPCPPEADCALPEPVEPQPPVDLPTEGAARQIALELLAATGLDVTDATVGVEGPFDAWYVMVEPRIDGLPVTGLLSSVSVGSKGAITNASGTLAQPERLGEYRLVDTRSAIDRLNEQQAGLSGAGGGGEAVTIDDIGTAVDPDSAAASDAAVATEEGAEGCKVQPDGSEICEGSGQSTPQDCPDVVPPVGTGDATESTFVTPGCVAPVPLPEPLPVPEPEPIEVVLTDAAQVLMLQYAIDGSDDSYLVPGYRFSNGDGAVVEVVAVADEGLAPTTTVPETTDSEPVPPTEVTEVPGSAPTTTVCEALVEDDGSGTTHTIQTCPATPIEPDSPTQSDPGEPGDPAG